MMKLAHDPVDSCLGRAVGVYAHRQLRRDGDAPDGGGNGHKFGRLALLEKRVRLLEEDEGAVGVDLRVQISLCGASRPNTYEQH